MFKVTWRYVIIYAVNYYGILLIAVIVSREAVLYIGKKNDVFGVLLFAN